MINQHRHLTDEEILLQTANESPAQAVLRIQAHLRECNRCQLRKEELQNGLAAFSEHHRQAWDPELPPIDDARARLQERIAVLAQREPGTRDRLVARSTALPHRKTALISLATAAACLLVAILLRMPLEMRRPQNIALNLPEEPNLRLTPGATVAVTKDDVCGRDALQAAPGITASLRRQVVERYGVTTEQPDSYEVDYLITPELGGATDVRNLWPEPYGDTVWNARVKDQLENRLHEMVCRGDVDLSTAQHAISTDWIAAYRKYFHADRPIPGNSSSRFSVPIPSSSPPRRRRYART